MFSWSNNDSSSSKPHRRGSNSNSNSNSNSSGNGSSNGRQSISRSEHLHSLMNDPTLKPSTRKVSRDDTTYDTVFQTKDENALILRTYYSTSHNSTSTPKMTLVGIQASHPWIDSKMRVVGYEPMANDYVWKNSGLTLGKAVNAIVQHFQFYPPQDIRFTDKSLMKIQPKKKSGSGIGGRSSGSSAANNFGFEPPPTPPPPSNVPPEYDDVLVPDATIQAQVSTVMSTLDIPDVPQTFPKFDNLKKEELTDLLNDQSKHQSKIEQMKLPCITKTESIKKSLLDGNVRAANKNLSKESSLSSLYSEVQVLQETLQSQVSTFEELKAKQDELCRPQDTDYVIRQLRMGKKDAFNESEQIASDWLHGDGSDGMEDVDSFLKSFIEMRTIHHVRAAKMECLGQK